MTSTDSTGFFPESQLAHSLLDGLRGIEIGPAAHNPFGLHTISVGLSKQLKPADYEKFEREQLNRCGKVAEIDISADASSLPIADDSTDFVIHSHVWEHMPVTPPHGFGLVADDVVNGTLVDALASSVADE